MDITNFDFVFSTGMKKILNIKDKNDKKVNKKISDQDYDRLTLIEKFCLMRSDFFINNYEGSKDNVIAARKWICKYYAQQFQDIDFPNFCLNVFDSIYPYIDDYNKELKQVEQHFSHQNMLKIFFEIFNNISFMKILVTDFNKILDPISEKNLPKIYRAKDVLEWTDDLKLKRKKILLSEHGVDVEFSSACIEFINKYFQNGLNLIKELAFDLNDNSFQATIDICIKNNCPKLTDIFTCFEYLLDPAFNKEVLLIFLFTSYEKKADEKIDYLFCVKEKTECFFKYLYAQLKKIPDKAYLKPPDSVDTLLEFNALKFDNDIDNDYIYISERFDFHDDRRYFFKLKKLLSLFSFYVGVANLTLPHTIKKALRDFRYILKESKLLAPESNFWFKDISRLLLDNLQITNRELADLLDINETTVHRQRKDDTLIKKNFPFWKNATGFSDTFLRGETTIPDYGKHDPNSDNQKYLFSPSAINAFGEIFLELIVQSTAYQYDIKKGKIFARRKNFLTDDPFINELSKVSLQLADEIKKQRLKVMKNNNQLKNYNNFLKREHELENGDLANPDLPKFQDDFNKYSAASNQYLSDFISILKDCIKKINTLQCPKIKIPS